MPRPQIDCWLVLADRRRFRLEPGRILVIGRCEEADIILHDALSSRQHAQLRWEDGSFWWIEDLGSRNGVLVNGEQIHARQQLMDGQRIQIGGSVLAYLMLPPGADPGCLEQTAEAMLKDSTVRPSSEPGFLESLGATFTGLVESPQRFIDLIQFLAITRKSGRMEFFAPRRGLSWLWVRDGIPIDAGTAHLHGMEALTAILGFGSARFAFFQIPVPPDVRPSIHEPPQVVILDLTRACG